MTGAASSTRAVRAAVLRWHLEHGRALSIRRLRDPYAIWIAETMSQQTQILRVEIALPGFLARFPSLRTLADAQPAEVIRAWTGLGYNRRAVGLWRAARSIVAERDGELPRSLAELEELPGIGPYTARAIMAFAYGAPVTALDTNSRRVLGRLLCGGPRPDGSRGTNGTRKFQARADALAPAGDARAWNHALMDLGATVCRSRPRCDACPLAALCEYRRSVGTELPARRKRSVDAAAASHADARRSELASRRRLRGRIVSTLRAAAVDAWVAVDPTAVDGAPSAVTEALATLERDGLIERDARSWARLRTGIP